MIPNIESLEANKQIVERGITAYFIPNYCTAVANMLLVLLSICRPTSNSFSYSDFNIPRIFSLEFSLCDI
jgi:hypothetical protein